MFDSMRCSVPKRAESTSLPQVAVGEYGLAKHGYRCGLKDRRPLDPPPVVGLRLFEVSNVGTSAEKEQELSDLSYVARPPIACPH